MDQDAEQHSRSPPRDHKSIFSRFTYQNVPVDEEGAMRSPSQWSQMNCGHILTQSSNSRGPSHDNTDEEDITDRISPRDSILRGSQTTFVDSPGEAPEPFKKGYTTSERASVTTIPYARTFACATRERLTRGRLTSITIFLIGLTSFVGSFLYVYAAFKKPDWSDRINTDGGLSPTTASLLCTLIAKIIELAFVTLVVASMGQYLSRRAIQHDRGITIPELFMRNWIVQPGSILTQFRFVRYSGFTLLGLFTFAATLAAMFYTTAAEALVSPKLTWGHDQDYNHSVMAYTKFGDSSYISKNCYIPGYQYANQQSNCVQLQNVGQAYHNYQIWLNGWNGIASQPSDLKRRPPPTGFFMENTTVYGAWLDNPSDLKHEDTTNRLINRVTYAFPHPAVAIAAVDPANKIRQPSFFGNSSKFDLEAAVASPIMNVLCASVSEAELSPLVYSKWLPKGHHFNESEFSLRTGHEVAAQLYEVPNKKHPDAPYSINLTNSTKIDSLFGWDNTTQHLRPIFGTFPTPNQTLVNVYHYGFDGVYILVGVPEELQRVGSPYVMCKLKAGLGGRCSTKYHAEFSGGILSAACDKGDLANDGPDVDELIWDNDWADFASTWVEATSLGVGLLGEPAASAGALTHFIPDSPLHPLPADRPSIAEALAVMAGSTLLTASVNVTTDTKRDPPWPLKQQFRSRLRGTIIQSGGQTQGWQNALFASLVTVCLISLLCCCFLVVELFPFHITDFTEPENMFTLAMNSPPTERLEGSCGAGPSNAQLRAEWKIDFEEEAQHYYIRPWNEKVLIGQVGPGASTTTLPRPKFSREFEKLQSRTTFGVSRSSIH